MIIKAYMHTINGLPARYVEGQQIYYLSDKCRNVLRYSLEEIKDDQSRSIKYREKRGFEVLNLGYGYRMFYL